MSRLHSSLPLPHFVSPVCVCVWCMTMCVHIFACEYMCPWALAHVQVREWPQVGALTSLCLSLGLSYWLLWTPAQLAYALLGFSFEAGSLPLAIVNSSTGLWPSESLLSLPLVFTSPHRDTRCLQMHPIDSSHEIQTAVLTVVWSTPYSASHLLRLLFSFLN